jgi:BirA family biotin operon repressor/biotin-[acetyl-CoA-carboxylase] ligase
MNKIELESLADQLLARIRLRPKHPFDPAKMSRSLKASVEEIAAAAGILKKQGYTIKTDGNGRYTFMAAPDSLLEAEISHELGTKLIGRKIHAYRSVQSTNIIAGHLAAAGEPEGTVVVAEHQTKGRGRLGRSWHSPEGTGLYCSIILRPRIHPTLAPGISLISAVAVADSISSYGDIDVKIKWPNDVLLSGRKSAGILTELSAEIDRTNFVIVGVGVNINQKASDFPANLRSTATSIRMALNKAVGRVEFTRKFLVAFEKQYVVFKKYGLSKSRKRILRYSSLINARVKLKIGRKTISGRVLTIDEQGRLVVETESGIERFGTGEVTTE